MEVVSNLSQLLANTKTLDGYLNKKVDPEYSYALGLIQRGTCFLTIKSKGNFCFYPSRFIGYVENTMDKHEDNSEKDGKVTNPAISAIIGCKPTENAEMERAYREYCEKFEIVAQDKGTFGVSRKYWVL